MRAPSGNSLVRKGAMRLGRGASTVVAGFALTPESASAASCCARTGTSAQSNADRATNASGALTTVAFNSRMKECRLLMINCDLCPETIREALISILLPAEAAPEQVRHLDEEGAPVAPEARFELPCEGTQAVARQIVVVADVKSCARVRRPTDERVDAQLRRDRVVIKPHARERKARELVRGAPSVDVVVEGNQVRVVADKLLLRVIERSVQGAVQLVVKRQRDVPKIARARIEEAEAGSGHGLNLAVAETGRLRLSLRHRRGTGARELRVCAEVEI